MIDVANIQKRFNKKREDERGEEGEDLRKMLITCQKVPPKYKKRTIN